MSKYCPSCGEELVDTAKFCKSCGANLENPEENHTTTQETPERQTEFAVPVAENDHKFAVIAGYVLAVLIPLFGFIAGIYLITRNSENAKKHGKYVMIVAVVIWIISFLLIR